MEEKWKKLNKIHFHPYLGFSSWLGSISQKMNQQLVSSDKQGFSYSPDKLAAISTVWDKWVEQPRP